MFQRMDANGIRCSVIVVSILLYYFGCQKSQICRGQFAPLLQCHNTFSAGTECCMNLKMWPAGQPKWKTAQQRRNIKTSHKIHTGTFTYRYNTITHHDTAACSLSKVSFVEATSSTPQLRRETAELQWSSDILNSSYSSLTWRDNSSKFKDLPRNPSCPEKYGYLF
jgi:hypothetical protein